MKKIKKESNSKGLRERAGEKIKESEMKSRTVEEREKHLSGILELAAEAFISINAEQKIIMFSRGAETMFGFTADEMIGQPVSRLMPERYGDVHARHIADFASSEEITRHMSRRQPVLGLRKNGMEFQAEASISKQQVAGEWFYTVILHDISERVKVEEEQLSYVRRSWRQHQSMAKLSSEQYRMEKDFTKNIRPVRLGIPHTSKLSPEFCT